MNRLGFDLIILGAPASGKDTQASLLIKRFGLKPVESGKFLRNAVLKHDIISKALKNNFSKGLPGPVKVIKAFIQKELRHAPKDNDLIFIGNPRLKPEAQMLKKLLMEKKRDFFVVYIQLPDYEIKKRAQARMRDDQDTHYIDNRIKFHKVQVSKTAKYFQSLNKLKFVSGKQPVNKVYADIIKIINDYQRSRGN